MKRIVPILSFAFVIGLCAMTFACPACKDSIPNSDAGAALPTGFNSSVYFMLAGFLSVLSMVVMFIIRSVRGTNISRGGPGFPLH